MLKKEVINNANFLKEISQIPYFLQKNYSGLNGFARTNAAYNSFRRQLSISERKQDPQTAIINEPPPSLNSKAGLEEIRPRPAPNPSLFDRQVKNMQKLFLWVV